MPSKSTPQGWLLIDNRLAPPEPGIPRFVEAGIVGCSHCRRQAVLNPERERERGYCRKCDHYICDQCAAVGECKPFDRFIDQAMTALARGLTMPQLGDF